MLSGMRQGLAGAGIKVLLVILALSFVLWGVGDALRSGQDNGYVFKVGDYELSQGQWVMQVRQQLDNLRLQYNWNASMQDAKRSGLLESMLQQLINKRLIIHHAQQIGLDVSNAMAQFSIASMPDFQNEQGVFDPDLFQRFLDNSRVSDQLFLQSVKDDIATRSLISALQADRNYMDTESKWLSNMSDISRAVEIYRIGSEHVEKDLAASEEDLVQAYEAHKNKFKIPAKRTIKYITLDEKNVQNIPEFSDDFVEDYYKQHITDFTTPETRQLQYMLLDTRAQADAARAALDKGEDFIETAKTLAKNSTFEMKDVTKHSFDEKLSQEIFKLGIGEVSQALETSLGWYIFKVTAISPERVRGLKEEKNNIIDLLRGDYVQEEFARLATRVDNALLQGDELEEIAENFGLQVESKILVQGSSEISNSAFTQQLEAKAFEADLDENTGLYTAHNAASFALKVTAEVPASYKDMNAVKDELLELWRADRQRRDMVAAAEALRSSLISGEEPEVKFTKDSKNFNFTDGAEMKISRPIWDASFNSSNGDISSIISEGNELVIVKVISTHANGEFKSDFKIPVYEMMKNEVIEQYITYLRSQYKVDINYELIDRIARRG
jgi:peptidyl-prolyl cis-trans isomerase D